MSLADLLSRPPERLATGPRCSVGKYLDWLPERDAEALQQALDGGVWRATQLHALAVEHHPEMAPARTAWPRHRRGDCSCQ